MARFSSLIVSTLIMMIATSAVASDPDGTTNEVMVLYSRVKKATRTCYARVKVQKVIPVEEQYVYTVNKPFTYTDAYGCVQTTWAPTRCEETRIVGKVVEFEVTKKWDEPFDYRVHEYGSVKDPADGVEPKIEPNQGIKPTEVKPLKPPKVGKPGEAHPGTPPSGGASGPTLPPAAPAPAAQAKEQKRAPKATGG